MLAIVLAFADPAAATTSAIVTPVASPSSAQTPSPSSVRTYSLPPDKYEKAIAYSRAGYRLYFLNSAYGIVVLALLLWMGFGARLRDWAERASRRRLAQAGVVAPLLIASVSVLQLLSKMTPAACASFSG